MLMKKIIVYAISKNEEKFAQRWVDSMKEADDIYVLDTGSNGEQIITSDEIVLNQYPDKNKSRNSYLPLLELAVSENPNDDRCIHYLGREYMYYNRNDEAIKWYDNSINEAPYLRDPYVEKALLMYSLKDYNQVIYLCNQALDITYNKKTYVNESFSFDYTIYDLLSLCYYFKNNKDLALYYIDKAINKSNNIQRLHDNKKYFENMT